MAVVAVAVVLWEGQRRSAEQAAWAEFANARGSSAALETARDRARETAAEPWVAFELSMQLYDEAEPASIERARQVAQETVERFPDHPTAPWLRSLLDATAN